MPRKNVQSERNEGMEALGNLSTEGEGGGRRAVEKQRRNQAESKPGKSSVTDIQEEKNIIKNVKKSREICRNKNQKYPLDLKKKRKWGSS